MSDKNLIPDSEVFLKYICVDGLNGFLKLAPVPDAETQSFARPARHLDANGREQVPVWTEKFEKAVAKNPCFMILR